MQLKKIGHRNLKTALSVLVCVTINALLEALLGILSESQSVFYRILYVFISRNMLVYACIAAVIVMCGSLSVSYKTGRERTAGTLLGGCAGIVFIFLKHRFSVPDIFLFPLGVVILIYFLTLIGKEEIVVVTLTVFFITLINSDEQAHIYVIAKVMATILGTVISLLVNRYIKPEEISNGEERKENKKE